MSGSSSTSRMSSPSGLGSATEGVGTGNDDCMCALSSSAVHAGNRFQVIKPRAGPRKVAMTYERRFFSGLRLSGWQRGFVTATTRRCHRLRNALWVRRALTAG